MKTIKLIAATAILIASGLLAHSQNKENMIGRWVNARDTTESLSLIEDGKFMVVSHDTLNNEYHRFAGTWLFKPTTKKKMFLFYSGNPTKQFLIVRKRGVLGYTINDMTRKLVYARRGLKVGEDMPKIESVID